MAPHTDDIRSRALARSALNQRLKELLVARLGLTVGPQFLGDDQPLAGRGGALGSSDVLEIVVLCEEEFGVGIHDDDRQAFGSVNKLADHVIASLGRVPGPEAGR